MAVRDSLADHESDAVVPDRLKRVDRHGVVSERRIGEVNLLYALETLDRRKPQERTRRFWLAREDQIEPE